MKQTFYKNIATAVSNLGKANKSVIAIQTDPIFFSYERTKQYKTTTDNLRAYPILRLLALIAFIFVLLCFSLSSALLVTVLILRQF
jgi:hypothetical protein